MDPFLFSGSSRATQIFVCSEQLPFLMLHYTRQGFGELIEDEDAASAMGQNTFRAAIIEFWQVRRPQWKQNHRCDLHSWTIC